MQGERLPFRILALQKEESCILRIAGCERKKRGGQVALPMSKPDFKP